MVKIVNERVVLNALRHRAKFIREKAATLSMKELRAHLEQDLKLQPQELKPFKKFLETKTLKLLHQDDENEGDEHDPAGPQDSDEENERPREKKEKKRKSEKPVKRPAPAEKEKKKSVKKAKAADRDKPAKKAKREKPEPADDDEDRPHKAAGGKTHGSRVLHLQSICKRATIKIPPNTYRGDPSEQELAERIEALLGKHGLSRKAGEREIMKTKARLQTERELEGIDTGNIVDGGRRARRAAAPTLNYKDLQGSSDSDDEPDLGSDSDSGSGSDSGAAPSDDGRRTKRRKSESSASEEAASGQDAEPEQEEPVSPPPKKEPAAVSQEKASPRKRRTVLDDSSDDDEANSPPGKRPRAESAAQPIDSAAAEAEPAADDSNYLLKALLWPLPARGPHLDPSAAQPLAVPQHDADNSTWTRASACPPASVVRYLSSMQYCQHASMHS
ncbi:hypothetical protein WJX73_001777 [Symbiochloris irregularis]|uniref:Histone chaperone domain-containing protein n=1 Tax=Symbiochloris irregularis TaxID=706552 RepID=A0AAW1PCI2_9CHLO